jgi:hypothetical protein
LGNLETKVDGVSVVVAEHSVQLTRLANGAAKPKRRATTKRRATKRR